MELAHFMSAALGCRSKLYPLRSRNGLQGDDVEWHDEIDDDDLRAATREYLPQTVIWTTDWTTGALLEQIRRGVFDVDPPFQRRNAWDDKKSSLYIESLLLGCPVPAITLAELSSESGDPRQYVVIDGKQRLGSLKRFAIDQTLRLTGLETLGNLNGLRFLDVALAPEFGRFENLPIRTVVMRNWHKDEVLQFVFHRLNSQVTPLSTHELRRALLPGPFTEYLDRRSAQSTAIQRILNIHEPDYRLRDAELLLRAIAFASFFSRYRGNLKQFLDSTTRSLNRQWASGASRRVSDLADEIDEAIRATFEIFGDAAFQRFEEGEPVGRFNRAIFDIMVLTFRHIEIRRAAIAERSRVVTKFVELMANPEFSIWTEATTKRRDAVEGRVDQWAKTLGGELGLGDLSGLVLSSAA